MQQTFQMGGRTQGGWNSKHDCIPGVVLALSDEVQVKRRFPSKMLDSSRQNWELSDACAVTSHRRTRSWSGGIQI